MKRNKRKSGKTNSERWQEYEQRKQVIHITAKSSKEYLDRIQALVQELGI